MTFISIAVLAFLFRSFTKRLIVNVLFELVLVISWLFGQRKALAEKSFPSIIAIYKKECESREFSPEDFEEFLSGYIFLPASVDFINDIKDEYTNNHSNN